MKIVVAPEDIICLQTEVKCFLGGGITTCPEWQKEISKVFANYDANHPQELDRLVVFNPRRDNFPIDDPNAAQQQISWEFNWLQKMDVFSMLFSAGESDQPICMYELGRNLQRMAMRFPTDFAERIVISCDPNYKRAQDVKIQTQLAFSEFGVAPPIIDSADPLAHMYQIIKAYKHVLIANNIS
jgi:hypothetical protein